MTPQSKPTSFQTLSQKTTPDGVQFSARVPLDLLYLDGHFEGAPVVAGVVQLDWVRQALNQHLGRPVAIAALEAVKFHQLLLPGQTFVLELRQKGTKWLFSIQNESRKIASGRIVPVEGS